MRRLFALLSLALLFTFTSCSGFNENSGSVTFSLTSGQVEKAVANSAASRSLASRVASLSNETLRNALSANPASRSSNSDGTGITKDDGTTGITVEGEDSNGNPIDVKALSDSMNVTVKIMLSVKLTGSYQQTKKLQMFSFDLKDYNFSGEDISDFNDGVTDDNEEYLDGLEEEIMKSFPENAEDKVYSIAFDSIPVGSTIKANVKLYSSISVSVFGFNHTEEEVFVEGTSEECVIKGGPNSLDVTLNAPEFEDDPEDDEDGVPYTVTLSYDSKTTVPDIDLSTVAVYAVDESKVDEKVAGDYVELMKLLDELPYYEKEKIGFWYMNSKIDQKNISVADDGTITVTGASKYLETGKEYYFYSFLQYYSNKGTAFGFGKPVKKTKIADKNDVELVITIYSEEEFGGDDPEEPYFSIDGHSKTTGWSKGLFILDIFDNETSDYVIRYEMPNTSSGDGTGTTEVSEDDDEDETTSFVISRGTWSKSSSNVSETSEVSEEDQDEDEVLSVTVSENYFFNQKTEELEEAGKPNIFTIKNLYGEFTVESMSGITITFNETSSGNDDPIDEPEYPDDPTIYFTISFFVSDDADAKFEDYEPFMIDGKAAVKTGSFKASEGSTTGEELMRSAFNSVSDVLYAANYTQEFLDDTESDDHNLVHKYYFVKKPNAGFEVEFEIVQPDDYTQMINLRWDENTGAFACESGFTSYTWFLDGNEVTAETDAARPTTTYIPDLSRLNSGTHTVAVTVTVAGSDDKVDSYTATGSFKVYEE